MMNNRMKIMLCAAAVLAALSFSGLQAGAGDQGEALLQKACTKCHSAKRICRNIGKKDGPWWEKTVTRMIGHGAKLSDEQEDTLVSSLAGAEKDKVTLCE